MSTRTPAAATHLICPDSREHLDDRQRVERFTVRCPTCGEPGRLVVAYARVGGGPSVRQFRCAHQMHQGHVLPSDAQLRAALPLVFRTGHR